MPSAPSPSALTARTTQRYAGGSASPSPTYPPQRDRSGSGGEFAHSGGPHQTVGPAVLSESTSLVAVNKGISSLRSILYLEQMVALRSLNLHMNQLVTLDAQIMASACMRNVTDLDVSGNDLESIQPVVNLRALKRLNVASNRIKSVEGLGALYQLEWLSLAFNMLEDILGMREHPGDALLFVDLSGNMLPRWESLDALTHCERLRELRITIARAPTTPLAEQSTKRATTSTAHSPHKDRVDEGALQLLDNPLVATPSYQHHVSQLLPQLVLLDGVRVGFDPLQDPASLGLRSSGRGGGGGDRPSPPAEPPLRLTPASLQQQSRIDDYLNGLTLAASGGSSPHHTLAATPSPIASTPNAVMGGARTKRVSRTTQTVPPPSALTASTSTDGLPQPSPTQESVQLAQRVASLTSRIARDEEELVEERAEHRRAVLKLQQLLAATRAERDDVREASRAMHASTGDALSHHLHQHEHAAAQILALKEQLQRCASDAERHEHIALKLQHDQLQSAAKDREAHHREKWQAKLASVERDHQTALRRLREEHDLQLRSASMVYDDGHHAVIASKDRTIGALQAEVSMMTERHERMSTMAKAQEVYSRGQYAAALAREEALSRALVWASEEESMHHMASWRAEQRLALLQSTAHREVQRLTQALASAQAALEQQQRDVAEFQQQLQQQQARLNKTTAPQSKADAATGTDTLLRHANEVTQTDFAPHEPCRRCPLLLQRIVECEAIIERFADAEQKSSARYEHMEDAMRTQRRESDDARHALTDELNGLQRTIANLKASMAAQDDAHRQELSDVLQECHEKVDEKRRRIGDLEEQLAQLNEALDASRRAVAALEQQKLKLASAAEAHNERRQVDEGFAREHHQLATQYQRLLEAVHTLRHQLVAVDSVNKTLVARNEALEHSNKTSEEEAQTLRDTIEEVRASNIAVVADRNKIRERLRRLAEDV